ncbi:MAG: hypothetical protein EOP34_06430 [Rickettsiales bacterium]|nr:MAG: hypothetical protein EOP34_06430 [Rickettsiales bacterium]
MSKSMNKIDFDTTMNSIALDSIVLIIFMTAVLVAIGTKMESGDVNAGSMLSVVYMPPLLPIVPLCLGLIKFSERFFKHNIQWVASLVPIVLMVVSFWLKSFDAYFVIGVLSVISIYSILKLILVRLTS